MKQNPKFRLIIATLFCLLLSQIQCETPSFTQIGDDPNQTQLEMQQEYNFNMQKSDMNNLNDTMNFYYIDLPELEDNQFIVFDLHTKYTYQEMLIAASFNPFPIGNEGPDKEYVATAYRGFAQLHILKKYIGTDKKAYFGLRCNDDVCDYTLQIRITQDITIQPGWQIAASGGFENFKLQKPDQDFDQLMLTLIGRQNTGSSYMTVKATNKTNDGDQTTFKAIDVSGYYYIVTNSDGIDFDNYDYEVQIYTEQDLATHSITTLEYKFVLFDKQTNNMVRENYPQDNRYHMEQIPGQYSVTYEFDFGLEESVFKTKTIEFQLEQFNFHGNYLINITYDGQTQEGAWKQLQNEQGTVSLQIPPNEREKDKVTTTKFKATITCTKDLGQLCNNSVYFRKDLIKFTDPTVYQIPVNSFSESYLAASTVVNYQMMIAGQKNILDIRAEIPQPEVGLQAFVKKCCSSDCLITRQDILNYSDGDYVPTDDDKFIFFEQFTITFKSLFYDIKHESLECQLVENQMPVSYYQIAVFNTQRNEVPAQFELKTKANGSYTYLVQNIPQYAYMVGEEDTQYYTFTAHKDKGEIEKITFSVDEIDGPVLELSSQLYTTYNVEFKNDYNKTAPLDRHLKIDYTAEEFADDRTTNIYHSFLIKVVGSKGAHYSIVALTESKEQIFGVELVPGHPQFVSLNTTNTDTEYYFKFISPTTSKLVVADRSKLTIWTEHIGGALYEIFLSTSDQYDQIENNAQWYSMASNIIIAPDDENYSDQKYYYGKIVLFDVQSIEDQRFASLEIGYYNSYTYIQMNSGIPLNFHIGTYEVRNIYVPVYKDDNIQVTKTVDDVNKGTVTCVYNVDKNNTSQDYFDLNHNSGKIPDHTVLNIDSQVINNFCNFFNPPPTYVCEIQFKCYSAKNVESSVLMVRNNDPVILLENQRTHINIPLENGVNRRIFHKPLMFTSHLHIMAHSPRTKFDLFGNIGVMDGYKYKDYTYPTQDDTLAEQHNLYNYFNVNEQMIKNCQSSITSFKQYCVIGLTAQLSRNAVALDRDEVFEIETFNHAKEISKGQTFEGYLAAQQYQYYKVNPEGQQTLILTAIGQDPGVELQLFVQVGTYAYPTASNHTWGTGMGSTAHLQITVQQNHVNSDFIVAVYGDQPGRYQITFQDGSERISELPWTHYTEFAYQGNYQYYYFLINQDSDFSLNFQGNTNGIELAIKADVDDSDFSLLSGDDKDNIPYDFTTDSDAVTLKIKSSDPRFCYNCNYLVRISNIVDTSGKLTQFYLVEDKVPNQIPYNKTISDTLEHQNSKRQFYAYNRNPQLLIDIEIQKGDCELWIFQSQDLDTRQVFKSDQDTQGQRSIQVNFQPSSINSAYDRVDIVLNAIESDTEFTMNVNSIEGIPNMQWGKQMKGFVYYNSTKEINLQNKLQDQLSSQILMWLPNFDIYQQNSEDKMSVTQGDIYPEITVYKKINGDYQDWSSNIDRVNNGATVIFNFKQKMELNDEFKLSIVNKLSSTFYVSYSILAQDATQYTYLVPGTTVTSTSQKMEYQTFGFDYSNIQIQVLQCYGDYDVYFVGGNGVKNPILPQLGINYPVGGVITYQDSLGYIDVQETSKLDEPYYFIKVDYFSPWTDPPYKFLKAGNNGIFDIVFGLDFIDIQYHGISCYSCNLQHFKISKVEYHIIGVFNDIEGKIVKRITNCGFDDIKNNYQNLADISESFVDYSNNDDLTKQGNTEYTMKITKKQIPKLYQKKSSNLNLSIVAKIYGSDSIGDGNSFFNVIYNQQKIYVNPGSKDKGGTSGWIIFLIIAVIIIGLLLAFGAYMYFRKKRAEKRLTYSMENSENNQNDNNLQLKLTDNLHEAEQQQQKEKKVDVKTKEYGENYVKFENENQNL